MVVTRRTVSPILSLRRTTVWVPMALTTLRRSSSPRRDFSCATFVQPPQQCAMRSARPPRPARRTMAHTESRPAATSTVRIPNSSLAMWRILDASSAAKLMVAALAARTFAIRQSP